ncbi:MAG TPA: hypothetical protein DIC22_12630 [Chitinophagaceae bacterium]|nr:hypothetical protein [Chitinophagaceae bacterium]
MKYILSILVTALLAFVSGLYLPWWGIAFAAFLVSAAIPQKPVYSFLSGFLGVFLLWEGLAWWIDNKNNGILSQKIANILPLGGSAVLLILITSIIGALVAGFAALAGSYLRRLIYPVPPPDTI